MPAVPQARSPSISRPCWADIHPEVSGRYYGCGLVAPDLLAGLRVLGLGCGSGRDLYLLSRLVGEAGAVVGVDMTAEQLAMAERHQDYHRARYDYRRSNVRLIEGRIEDLGAMGLEPEGFDLIVSNCVINLSPDKPAVLAQAQALLKPGGGERGPFCQWQNAAARTTGRMPGWAPRHGWHSHRLKIQPATFRRVEGDDTDEHGDTDVPDGEGGGDQHDVTLQLVEAKRAAVERQLHPGQEQDNAQHRGRKQAEQQRHRVAQEQADGQQQPPEQVRGPAGMGAETHMTGHATGAVAHGDTAQGA